MTSTVGPMYTALEALAAAALPTFNVVVGQVGTYVAGNQLLLGDCAGTEDPKTMGYPNTFAESYGITCELHCFAGGDDIEAQRTAVITAWQALRSAINTDRTLGISDAMSVWISQYSLTAGFDGPDENGVIGVSAQCQFVVQVTNLTT